MNSIVIALKEQAAQAGTANQWKLEELCKMAALEIETKAAIITHLTKNLKNANTAATSLQIQNAKLIGDNACLTAAHEMQGESLVVLPRWMVSNMEDKLKAQAAEIARLTDKLIPTYAEVEPK